MFVVNEYFAFIEQLEGLVNKMNYMIPPNWNIENFNQYIKRIQKTSKKTKWKRNIS